MNTNTNTNSNDKPSIKTSTKPQVRKPMPCAALVW